MRSYVPETGIESVQANGIRHAFFTEGSGPLVLMLHGFPDTPHTWDAIRPAVAAAGYRVVTPFLRGYAPSEIPEHDTDAKTQGQDVLALIDALGENSAIVVGHDWGASAAYSAAALGPEKVRKLVTVGIPHPASLKPSLGLLWSIRHFVTLRLPGSVTRAAKNDYELIETLTRRWGPTWNFGAEELEPVKNAFAAPGCLNAAIGYYRTITPIIPAWLRGKLSMPTLSFAGADDPNITPQDFEAARRYYTDEYRVVTVPGGHFLHRESGPEFTRELLEFLDA
ncbi:MAG TPA: alpha/beta hydrolase [Polyangiaceae bacterium]|nr:alpha/beta hydrolase [Polyangiaceae bacterium]